MKPRGLAEGIRAPIRPRYLSGTHEFVGCFRGPWAGSHGRQHGWSYPQSCIRGNGTYIGRAHHRRQLADGCRHGRGTARLQRAGLILMSSGDPAGQAARLEAAADRLRIDAATAEVLAAFRAAGVEALVLKGPSLTGWLYTPDDANAYLDSDLLLRPGDERAATKVLTELGFEPEQ